MTFFEYIKNEATVEQIAHMFEKLGDDVCELFDAYGYDYENTFAHAINYITDQNFNISSDHERIDTKVVEMLNLDIDEHNKISKEIKELLHYIAEIKEALKDYDEGRLYELVDIIIHKYKEYIVIVDEHYGKKIRFKYNKYGRHYDQSIIRIKLSAYKKIIANDNK